MKLLLILTTNFSINYHIIRIVQFHIFKRVWKNKWSRERYGHWWIINCQSAVQRFLFSPSLSLLMLEFFSATLKPLLNITNINKVSSYMGGYQHSERKNRKWNINISIAGEEITNAGRKRRHKHTHTQYILMPDYINT